MSIDPALCVLALSLSAAPVAAADAWHLREILVAADADGPVISDFSRSIDGGFIDIDVPGTALQLCERGSERIRFNWTFARPVASVIAGQPVQAQLEVRQVAATPPCNDAITRRASFSLSGSDGWQTPALPAATEALADRGMFAPATAVRVFGRDPRSADTGRGRLRVGPRTPDAERPLAYFYLTAQTIAGSVEVIYVYDKRLTEPRVIPDP